VTIEFRVSERSDLDTGEAADGMSDAPMAVVMEMATEVTADTAETAGGTIFEPMVRNKYRKWTRRS